MKKVSIPCLAAIGVLAHADGTTRPPNVVSQLGDDQGWMDCGFMGHPHVQTPNLEKLASEELLYERGYVTAPMETEPSMVKVLKARSARMDELEQSSRVCCDRRQAQ